MKSYIKIFFYVFTLITLFGLLVGTLNLWNPNLVHIPDNKTATGFEGMEGVLASVLSTGVLGIAFGIIGVLIAMLFKAGEKKFEEAPLPDRDAKKDVADNVGEDL